MSSLPVVLGAFGWVFGVGVLAVLRRRLELVARAEHELRGAVTVLGLSCRRLRREPRGLRHAVALEGQLARLGAGLADLTAARSGRRPAPRPGPTELGAVTRAALAPWEAAGAGFSWLGGPAVTNVDRAGLAKVLGNLMANAAEHGSGDIKVRGRSTPAGVRIEVRNGNPRRSGAAEQRGAPDEGGAPGGDGAPGEDGSAQWRGGRGGPAQPLRRGRGLLIADQAARDLGGRLLVQVGERETVAVLELPRTPGGDEEFVA